MQVRHKVVQVPSKTRLQDNPLNEAGIQTWGNYAGSHPGKGKVAGLRLECNVSWTIDDQGNPVIKDDTRIRTALPDVASAIIAGYRPVVMFHIEDKKEVGGTKFKDNALVTERMQALLEAALGRSVTIDRVKEDKFYGPEAAFKIEAFARGQLKVDVLVLQNVRLDKGDRTMEKGNDPALITGLASYFDVYVDACTGAMHRNAATNNAIKRVMREAGKPVIAGDLYITDTAALQRLINGFKGNPEKSVALFAGSKIANTTDEKGKIVEEGKIEILKSFVSLGIRNIALGGKMVNPFLVVMGKSVGAAKVDEEEIQLAREIIALAREKGVMLHFPKDYITVHKDDLMALIDWKPGDPFISIRMQEVISADRVQVDIGEKTRGHYADMVRTAEYRLYNGPMGVFEYPLCRYGTLAIADAFARADYGFGILGGGDTNTAVAPVISKSTPYTEILPGGGAPMKFISTGGSLETIELMREPK